MSKEKASGKFSVSYELRYLEPQVLVPKNRKHTLSSATKLMEIVVFLDAQIINNHIRYIKGVTTTTFRIYLFFLISPPKIISLYGFERCR